MCWPHWVGTSTRLFVERINLTIRQHVTAVGRLVSTLCKGKDGLQQQLAVFHCSIPSPKCAT